MPSVMVTILKLECPDIHPRPGLAREAALVLAQSERWVAHRVATGIESRAAMEQSHCGSRAAIISDRSQKRIDRSDGRTDKIAVNAITETRAAVDFANKIVAK